MSGVPAAAGAQRPGRRVLTGFVFPFAIFALLGTLWALASPVFSVPDEPAHVTKAIAQLRGQVIGYEVEGVRHIVVDLPEGYYYNGETLCYATHPEQDASCSREFGDPSGQDWFNTWTGAYNPIYYELIGWPSLIFDGNASVYAMRIASAVLCALLLAGAFLAATSAPGARWMPLGIAFAAMPMSLYLMGAVNPNGAEIAGAVALWAGLLRLLETFGDDRTRTPWLGRGLLWTIVAAGAIVLANSRSLGPLWVVIVILICFAAAGWRPVRAIFTTPRSWIPIGIIAAGGLFSVLWTLWGGSLGSQAEVSDAPLVGAGFLAGLAYMVRATPDHWHQALGYFGWIDADLPVWVFWFGVAAIAALLVLAFTAPARRGVLTVALVAAAALAVPPLIQAYSINQTGIIWQGRYGLWLFLGVGIVATWVLDRYAPRVADLASRYAGLVGSGVAAFGVLAFFFVLVRYVIGTDQPYGDMLRAPLWQPPLGWLPLTVAYAVVSAALVVLVVWCSRRAQPLESTAAAAGAPARERALADG
jgi:hypothetical protein